MSSQFIKGANYMLRGFELLKEPKLRLFVLTPLLINFLVFGFFIALGSHYFDEFSQWFSGLLPTWLHWLKWLLWLIFALLCLVLSACLFTISANLIGSPFNSFLSEKIETHLTGTLPAAAGGWLSIVKALPHSLIRQIKIIIYYSLRSAIFFVLSLIPIVHFFAIIGWFLFTSWMLTMQYLDYPMDNNQISFARLRELLQQNRLLVLGFGMTAIAFTMIPLLNLLVMPAAVAGATLLWTEQYRHQALAAPGAISS